MNMSVKKEFLVFLAYNLIYCCTITFNFLQYKTIFKIIKSINIIIVSF